MFTPEVVVGTKHWVVSPDAKHRALLDGIFAAPVKHRYAVAALLPTAFQTGMSIFIFAVLQASKVDDCLLVFATGGFLEWIFVAPVQAVVFLTIPLLNTLKALARDGLCSMTSRLVATDAKTSCEASWTLLFLPPFLPAPVQLSFAVGVPSADIWSEIPINVGVPLPLLDANVGVSTDSHM